MNAKGTRRPNPTLVVAMVALFVALGGTAGAVVNAAVPLAKRALVADKAKVATTAKTANTAKVATTAKRAQVATNAERLGGGTVQEVITAAAVFGAEAALEISPEGPRPASTAVGLVTLKASGFSLGGSMIEPFTVSCDPGHRALGGGFSTFGTVVALGSFPSSSGSAWSLLLRNELGTPTTGDAYVTCLK